MPDKHDANEIFRDLNDGNVDEAIANLSEEYLSMSPQEFGKLIDEIDRKSRADDIGPYSRGNNIIVERDADGTIRSVKLDGLIDDTVLFNRVKVIDEIGSRLLSDNPKIREDAEADMKRAVGKLSARGELSQTAQELNNGGDRDYFDGLPDGKVVKETIANASGQPEEHTFIEFEVDNKGYAYDITRALNEQKDKEQKTEDKQKEDAEQIYAALKNGDTRRVMQLLQSYNGVEFQSEKLIEELNTKLRGTGYSFEITGGFATFKNSMDNDRTVVFNITAARVEGDGLPALKDAVKRSAERESGPKYATKPMRTDEEIKRLLKGTRPNGS